MKYDTASILSTLLTKHPRRGAFFVERYPLIGPGAAENPTPASYVLCRRHGRERKERPAAPGRTPADRMGGRIPGGASILCIQNRCHPKKPRCRKASGIFLCLFSKCNFGRCQYRKTPCGWDPNVNNRLLGEILRFFSRTIPPFIKNLFLDSNILTAIPPYTF